MYTKLVSNDKREALFHMLRDWVRPMFGFILVTQDDLNNKQLISQSEYYYNLNRLYKVADVYLQANYKCHIVVLVNSEFQEVFQLVNQEPADNVIKFQDTPSNTITL